MASKLQSGLERSMGASSAACRAMLAFREVFMTMEAKPSVHNNGRDIGGELARPKLR